MLDLDRICYLRWVRGLAARPPARVPLTFSGMSSPEPGDLGAIPPAAFLAFDESDHPELAARLAREWGIDAGRVVLAPGSHFALLLVLMQRLSESSGPVVVESPAYEPLWRIPEALGAEVLRWPRPRENDFALDPDALEGLVARRPSAMLFSHPHNPSGVTFTEADRNLVTELHARTGALLISDEVYLEFEPRPAEVTLLDLVEDLVIVRSFTKVFGLGPIRCSAIAGPTRRIHRLALATDYAHGQLPAPTLAVAARFWERREELWSRAREASRVGRIEVEAWLERAGGRVESYLPASGIICFPRLRDDVHDAAVQVARRRGVVVDPETLPGVEPATALWIADLFERTGIQLTPGEFFGDPRGFRIGFGIDAGLLRSGLDGIDAWLDQALEEA